MHKILKPTNSIPDSSLKYSDSDIDNGLILSFPVKNDMDWIGIFKKGSNKITKIIALSDTEYFILSNGLLYLVDTSLNTVKRSEIEYTDSKLLNGIIFLSTYSTIDIYCSFKLIKTIIIDDIDGIVFKKVKSSRLQGLMRQIDDRIPNDWINFSIHISSFDFECDSGRSWTEKTLINDQFKIDYLTMDLKNVNR